MRSLEEREEALNRYFKDGESYKQIAKAMDLPLDTVKSWCLRHRRRMDIPRRDKSELRTEPVRREDIHKRVPNTDSQEDRIARLEMEVDLLRNFLILEEGR
jgi:transposase-like protein